MGKRFEPVPADADDEPARTASVQHHGSPPSTLPWPRRGGQLGQATRWLAIASAAGAAVYLGFVFKAAKQSRGCPIASADGIDPSAVARLYADGDPLRDLGVTRAGDADATAQWLAAASAAGSVAQAQMLSGTGAANPAAEAEAAIRRAASAADTPAEIRRLARRAMHRAVEDVREKRASLGKFVNAKRRRRSLKGRRKDTSLQQNVYTAHCVFDVLQATTSLAFVAANVNDAVRTCPGLHLNNLMSKNNTQGKLCALNAAFAFGEIANLAAELSLAANDCAVTLLPNVDALCAASVSGLVYGIAEMAAGGALIATACNGGKFLGEPLPPGATPANVSFSGMHAAARRLEEDSKAVGGANAPEQTEGLKKVPESGDAAPDRKLLFGGGKGSTSTQCATQVGGSMWSLAQAALYITQATKGSIGPLGQCPPKNVFGGKKFKGPVYKQAQAFCAQNVAGILVAYAQILAFIQMAVVDCANVFNLPAICGTGITAVAGSFAAVAETGPGIFLACDELQDPLLKKAINAAAKLDTATGNTLSKILGDSTSGRRLDQRDNGASRAEARGTGVDDDPLSLDDIKSRFDTPADAFRSIGIDFDDPEFQRRRHEAQPSARRMEPAMSVLVEEPGRGAAAVSTLCKEA